MLCGRYKFYFARGDDVGQRGGKLAADNATGLLLLRESGDLAVKDFGVVAHLSEQWYAAISSVSAMPAIGTSQTIPAQRRAG